MESLNQVLIDCVKAAGGSANVGPKLWPEKTREAAQRYLLDCLSDDRPAKLSPEHVLLVLRLARAKGHHEGVAFILSSLGYAPTTPIEPKDEIAELQRQYIETGAQMSEMAARMEKMAQRIEAVHGFSPMLKVAA
jgi:hypothetical protein